MKKCRFLQPFYVHVEQCLWNQAQQLHLSNDAPLQMQPWEHLVQPTGQQEQQLFLQEVHLHCLHVQELAQLQEPPVVQEQLGSILS